MSKGLGSFQQLVLSRIGAGTQRNELCWQLAEELKHVRTTEPAGLSDSFYTAFSRAVRRLAERRLIEIRKRRLETIDELIRYYPFKTTLCSVRRLRGDLLPVLPEIESGLKRPAYTPAQNEDFFFNHLRWITTKPDVETRRNNVVQWSHIEDGLVGVLPSIPVPERGDWLRLLARGQELFTPKRGITCSASIAELLDRCARTSRGREVVAAARTLLNGVLTENHRAHLALKTRLYAFVNFRPRGSSELKAETKMALFRLRRGVVEALPGHQPADPDPEEESRPGRMRRGWRDYDLPTEVEAFSPLLDQLLDKHCLEEFEFLYRTEQ